MKNALVVLSDEVMGRPGVADVFFDTFEVVEQRTTDTDRLNNRTRWLLRSELFHADREIEYNIYFEELRNGRVIVRGVLPTWN